MEHGIGLASVVVGYAATLLIAAQEGTGQQSLQFAIHLSTERVIHEMVYSATTHRFRQSNINPVE